MKLQLLPSLILLLLTNLSLIGQMQGQICDDWKSQSTAYVVTGSTPYDPDYFQWEEKSNNIHGVHLCVLNADVIPVYIQQNNNYINFTSRFSPVAALLYMIRIEVNINDAGYVTLYSGSAKQDIVWHNSSGNFPEIGDYDLKLRVYFFDGTITNRQYNIKVIPASQKLYKDNAGNTLRKWTGNDPDSHNTIVFSEGFDAYNTNGQEMYYHAAADLVECFRENGYDVFLLDNYFGTQDIRNNASIFASAVNFISSIYNDELIVAGGVSMGGIISRYALAKAEQENKPLPVHTFLAIDSPHQGAVISETLQNFKKENEKDDEFAKHALSNSAARQLLNYNAYDPSGATHNAFFHELNTMNGDGYPHLTRNIGVSFSTNDPNPNSGCWYKITYHTGPLNGTIKTFDLTAAEKEPGSWLPKDLTSMSPIIKRASYWWLQLLVPIVMPLYYPTIEFERFTDPAYIQYTSALDIRNGNSLFDVCIEPESTSWHDILPLDILEEIMNEVIKTDRYLQNKRIYAPWTEHGKKVVAGNYITSLLPQGDVVVYPGADLSIEASEQVMLREGFRVLRGGNASIIANDDMYFECSNTKNISITAEDPSLDNDVIINKNLLDGIDINIFPNPAKDQITVQVLSGIQGSITIEVYDILCRPVLNKFIPAGGAATLDISLLNKGTYVVRVSNGRMSKSSQFMKI